MIGQTLGSYTILSELGTGGMGVIYRAEHQMIGKRAAIKVLRPEMSQDREIVGRFFNEAKAVAAIDHPGLVDIYDFGYASDGSAYIVMELLSGESLATRLHHPMDIELTLSLLRQMCGAIAAAHELRVVHRDLKPDNIFLVPDPDIPFGVRAKVLDFGIAKLAPELGGFGSETRSGMMLGTPMYMAPEQCRGAGDVDHRADIYALGVILFEMVTGRTPFTGAGIGEIIAKHQLVAPPEPRSIVPSIPAQLEALILAMLAKEPARRPQTMHEVLRALDGRVEPPVAITLAPHPMAVAAPTPFVKRRRVPWIPIGIAITIAAAAVPVILLATRSPSSDSPFDHLDILPAETELVAGLDVGKLVRTELWRDEGPALLAALDANDDHRMLAQLRLSCDLDLARDIHWVLFVVDSAATMPTEAALVVNGNWDREKMERCFTELDVPNESTMVHKAAGIDRRGDFLIRWLSRATVAIAFNAASADEIGRLNLLGSPTKHALSVAAVDHAATFWFTGLALRPFPRHLDPLGSSVLDQAGAVTGSVVLDDDAAKLHFALTGAPGEAQDLHDSLERKLATLPVLAGIRATVQDLVLTIDWELDRAAVRQKLDPMIAKLRHGM